MTIRVKVDTVKLDVVVETVVVDIDSVKKTKYNCKGCDGIEVFVKSHSSNISVAQSSSAVTDQFHN